MVQSLVVVVDEENLALADPPVVSDDKSKDRPRLSGIDGIRGLVAEGPRHMAQAGRRIGRIGWLVAADRNDPDTSRS
jgi:hypothetical protein